MESGTDDASHEWPNGLRDAHRNSSSDTSTSAGNGIPGVPRVDRWDARLGTDCGRAVKSQNARQSRRRDDTYVLCGSALTGATRGNAEVSRQNHSIRRKRARHSWPKGALSQALRHRKHPGPCARCLLACASFEIREFLEIVALCPTSLAFNLSQVSTKRFSCRGSQRSSTRRVDMSRREQKG